MLLVEEIGAPADKLLKRILNDAFRQSKVAHPSEN
jgi:hypothetical protein